MARSSAGPSSVVGRIDAEDDADDVADGASDEGDSHVVDAFAEIVGGRGGGVLGVVDGGALHASE
jgi:hypothetical protein